jgi:hypothetical protein
MKPVVQGEKTGCGIAVVATLAGVTYQDARSAARTLNISAADERLWSDSGYVRTLLSYYGIKPVSGHTAFVSWKSLPSTALLAIKWHRRKGRAFWHWVVFRRGPDGPMVLDPNRSLRTNERTDFGRMKPKWYIAIGALPREPAEFRTSFNPTSDGIASPRRPGPRQ